MLLINKFNYEYKQGVKEGSYMKKELIININDYILLEFLHMLDYFSYDDIIEEKLKQLRKLVNQNVYGDFFKNLNDIEILNQQFKLKYTFKAVD